MSLSLSRIPRLLQLTLCGAVLWCGFAVGQAYAHGAYLSMELNIVNNSTSRLIWDHEKSDVVLPQGTSALGRDAITAGYTGVFSYFKSRADAKHFFQLRLRFVEETTRPDPHTVEIAASLNNPKEGLLISGVSAEAKGLQVSTKWDLKENPEGQSGIATITISDSA